MRPEEAINQSKLITDIYGKWPSFHDFEIIKAIFERSIENNELGPFITLSIHMWEVRGRSKDGKTFIFGNHHIAEIRCNSVAEYEFKDFNQQNAIDDIEITNEIIDNTQYKVIRFPGLFGVDASIKCKSIEVLSVRPGIPNYSVYDKKGL